jgi:hypothetical protein
MKLSFSLEADSRSTGKAIICFLWNPNANYCVRKSMPLDPILSHMLKPHFLKIHFTIILLPMPRFSKLFIPFWFSD